jgi:hypothetical protein
MIHKTLLLTLVTTLSLYGSCQELTDDVAIGSCYEQEGNINLSQAAYERALFYNKDNTEAKMKLIDLYRSEGMDKDADALLATVDERQLTPQQRTTLATLRGAERDNGTFRARVTLDLGYDDNININHIYDTTFTTDAQGTRFLRFNADLSYQYDFSDANGWFLRSDANLYHQYNLDFESDFVGSHYYDTLYGRLYAGGGYATKNISIYVPLFYDRLNYLNVDLFSEIGVRPDFNMMFAKMFVLNVNMLYSKRSYERNIDKMRDDSILALESGFYWIQNRDNAYAKIRYEKYTPQDANAIPLGTKVFVDKALASLTLGGLYSITNIMDIRAQLLYRKGDFKEIPLFFGSLKRDDTTKDVQLSFERDLTKELRAHIQFHYLDNDSNYNQAIFTKKEALIGLVYNY